MPQERLLKEALLAKVKGKRPVGQTRWSTLGILNGTPCGFNHAK